MRDLAMTKRCERVTTRPPTNQSHKRARQLSAELANSSHTSRPASASAQTVFVKRSTWQSRVGYSSSRPCAAQVHYC